MTPRPYQSQAVASLWDYMRVKSTNPVIEIPTAGGKSPVMAMIARQAVEEWKGRVGILADVQELVEQNYAKMRAIWPEAPAGIYAAGLKRRDRFDKILFMQIQSVFDKSHQLGWFDILLIDEAHMIALKQEGRYRIFIEACRRVNPALRVVGLTATPYRLGGGVIYGPDYILNEVCYRAEVRDLIEQGFLSPLVSKGGQARPDTSGVHIRGREFIESELTAVTDTSELVKAACAEMIEYAADRKAWIVFCVNVEHAHHVADELRAQGVTCAVVSGQTPKGERKAALDGFNAGTFRALVNVNVFSKGFDAPQIDCVVMMRATKSPGLYYQQVGRGFRLHPGKRDCLVLDFAGNILEHGPVDQIRVQQPRKAGAKAEVVTGKAKECPKCSAIVPVQTRTCECGHAWGSAEASHLAQPTGAAILSGAIERKVAEHVVGSVRYDRHSKPGKVPSLKVTYQCGLRRFSEWVCVEHGGQARNKASNWWKARDPACELVPRTVEAAMAVAYSLPQPLRITVDETDKFPEILAYAFAEREPTDRPDTGGQAAVGPSGSPACPDPVPGLRGAPQWLLPSLGVNRAA